MAFRVNDIYIQKINEIQSRIPVKLNIPTGDASFQEILDRATSTESGSSSTLSGSTNSTNRSLNILRAQQSLQNFGSSIPKEKANQMQIIDNSIHKASQKYNLDADLIRSVIKQESDFNPYSLSSAGAQGLMQLMPETADALNVSNPWDIAQNIDGGTAYLRDQLKAFNGNMSLALAAYNAGPNSVKKYNGIPPYAETQDYVNRVLMFYKQYKNP